MSLIGFEALAVEALRELKQGRDRALAGLSASDKDLEGRLTALEAENARLRERLARQREEIQRRLAALEALLSDDRSVADRE